VLLALCVIVSLLGIANALVLATFERTRELGTLRALGMSRRQLRRMVRAESIVTALLGAVLGAVVGLGLAAIVTSLLSDQGLQFVIPTAGLVVFAVLAVLAGIAAAALPARRAARMDVLAALAVE
jgi:putative ABC transport system permease protein